MKIGKNFYLSEVSLKNEKASNKLWEYINHEYIGLYMCESYK